MDNTDANIKTVSKDPFLVAGREIKSRLLVGTGKYFDSVQAKQAIQASGADVVTVAVRRINLKEEQRWQPIEDYIATEKYTYLPNSSGCYNAKEAVRNLCLAREIGGWDLVKLEVIGDEESLFPDMEETFIAAKELVAKGFKVMVYTNDDPIYAKKLEGIGVAAVMPMAAPIGSGLGIQNKVNLKLIIDQLSIPVIVDAGIGTASDAVVAMEMGCDGVLLNTAIAEAKDPCLMASAMRRAVIAGREAYLAGRMKKRNQADKSSPKFGVID